MSANFEMMVFKIDGDNADFVNGFANKSELINYLLKNAKKEYEKSKLFFAHGMSTIAASKLEADALKVQIECKNDFDFNPKSPIDQRILQESEENE